MIPVLDEDGNQVMDDVTGLPKTEEVECWVYNEEDPTQLNTLYTCGNLAVPEELMQSPSLLGFRLPDGKEDLATAEALKAAFKEEEYTLNPNVQKTTNFINYYMDLVSQIGNTGWVQRSIYENQVGTVDSINNAREQVVGVSSDEELSNMVRFQSAYNASSRYINVVSEMLEHIISTLGR